MSVVVPVLNPDLRLTARENSVLIGCRRPDQLTAYLQQPHGGLGSIELTYDLLADLIVTLTADPAARTALGDRLDGALRRAAHDHLARTQESAPCLTS